MCTSWGEPSRYDSVMPRNAGYIVVALVAVLVYVVLVQPHL